MAGAIVSVLFLAALWAIAIFLSLPIWMAALVTLLVVFGWASLLVWRGARARGAARELEKSLGQQADAQAGSVRPDQQLEIAAMQAEFQKAVQSLKSSRLGRGGKNALAVLPWYMIIGPPGAGKSTALRASGLKFPYLSARGGGVKGVGGTRNCEWWLTNDAVILDTAGRYATEEEDHDEWFSFLDTLQRTRPARPINGLIVAVSVGDLGGESEDGIIEMARLLRERVDEVMSRLQLVLPAYLLFTKSDLIPGFVETFADLRKNERGQIWGFTLPIDAQATDHAASFRERFEELSSCIEERALQRLGDERQLAARARIHGFPQQLEALLPNLATLVEHLFAENAYQDTPLLRGVYFTSGTQEGRTIDRVMSKMADAFGIRPQLQTGAPVLEAKSYFLREVFAGVIFPDRELAVRNARGEKRRALRRYVAVGACATAALSVLFFPLRSFLLNRAFIAETGEIVDAAVARDASAAKGPQAAARLEPLRERLVELLDNAEDGAPLAMRFGLYQGNELLPHLRRLFAGRVRASLIDPIYRADVADLDALARRFEGDDAPPPLAEHGRSYDRLKLHLLLTAPRSRVEPPIDAAEQEWIAAQVASRWSADGDAAPPQAVADDARLYARLLPDDPALALPRYEDVVQRVRRVLRRVSLSSLALDKLVAGLDGKGYDLTLAALLGGPVPVLKSEARVPGAFTRRAYEAVAKDQLENASKLLEPWVLEAEASDAGALQARQVERLRSAYFQRYIEHWRAFVDAIQVAPATGGAQSLAMLQDLTGGEPPPLRRLFRAVGYNTQLGGTAAALVRSGGGVVEKIRQQLGSGGDAPGAVIARVQGERDEAPVGPGDVERAFAGFVAFGAAPELPQAVAAAAAAVAPAAARSVPLDLYQEQLAFIRDALQTATENGDAGALVARVQAARTRLRALIDSQDVGFRPRLETLLWPPLEVASRSSAREAAGGASIKWCSAVALPFRRNIASRYPFRPGGEPAALADVAEFFRPNSGLLWGFYNEALRNDVQRAGDGFQFARSLGGVSGFRPELLAFLRRAQEITSVLFPGAAPEPKVQLSAKIRPTPRVAAVWLEVDGQRFDYRNGPEEWHDLAWPMAGKSPGASLRVRTVEGGEETLREDGEWGLLQLLEAGQSEGAGRDFAVTWTLPTLGLAVAVDFRSARSDTPFFGGSGQRAGKRTLLRPLRNGIAVPLSIARGKSGCELVAKP